MVRSEENCTFKLGVEKKFDHEGKTIAPPPIKWSAPNDLDDILAKVLLFVDRIKLYGFLTKVDTIAPYAVYGEKWDHLVHKFYNLY